VDIVNSLAVPVAPINMTQIEEAFDPAESHAQAFPSDQKR
jgi:hypothetical protein